ncbi:ABC transporter permease [Paenibacillus sp. CMAA1364]
MFLAWNEIKKNKLRFILIMGVLMLVSYLVFFLSGLATGLQSLNRESVDKWKADAIVLTQESDSSLGQSSFMVKEESQFKSDEKAILSQLNTIVNNGESKQNISLFGIRKDEFIMPNVTEGNEFSKPNEVIASDALIDEGFKVGDELSLSSTQEKLTIVGFTDAARFNAAPVLYGDMDTFLNIKYGEFAEENEGAINAIVLRTDDMSSIQNTDQLEVIELETFIRSLPGYTEQSLTLNFMIYFLFAIAAIIVTIFLYVLTVQKISMFGVMKAQGISNGYLAKSVFAQTFILATIGVLIGFILTIVTGAFLPSAVPVAFDYMTMIIYGLVLIVFSVFGALISVYTIVKIDPLKAIGG